MREIKFHRLAVERFRDSILDGGAARNVDQSPPARGYVVPGAREFRYDYNEFIASAAVTNVSGFFEPAIQQQA